MRASVLMRVIVRATIGPVILLSCLNVGGQVMAPWLTRSADNSRSGWNSHETVLTQFSVGSKGIVRATIIPVLGDARGMEAQPLILPNVKLGDGSTHDVMVLPSMANVVRGVDAHTGAGLWSVTLGVPDRPIDGSVPIGPKPGPDNCVGEQMTIDCHAINDKWGSLEHRRHRSRHATVVLSCMGLTRRHSPKSAAQGIRVERRGWKRNGVASVGGRDERNTVLLQRDAKTAEFTGIDEYRWP